MTLSSQCFSAAWRRTATSPRCRGARDDKVDQPYLEPDCRGRAAQPRGAGGAGREARRSGDSSLGQSLRVDRPGRGHSPGRRDSRGGPLHADRTADRVSNQGQRREAGHPVRSGPGAEAGGRGRLAGGHPVFFARRVQRKNRRQRHSPVERTGRASRAKPMVSPSGNGPPPQ